jgi:hypothetical protein
MMPRSGTVCLLLMLAMALTSLTKRMRRSLSLSGGYLQSVTKILRGKSGSARHFFDADGLVERGRGETARG